MPGESKGSINNFQYSGFRWAAVCVFFRTLSVRAATLFFEFIVFFLFHIS